jgi:transcriptional regulator with GAF, ATPase, and Fis domain
LQRTPSIVVRDNPGIPLARITATKEVVHIPDLSMERAYIDRNPRMLALVHSAHARTLLAVPMLKENELIGAVVIYRQEVRPFSDKLVALIASFANQAYRGRCRAAFRNCGCRWRAPWRQSSEIFHVWRHRR